MGMLRASHPPGIGAPDCHLSGLISWRSWMCMTSRHLPQHNCPVRGRNAIPYQLQQPATRSCLCQHIVAPTFIQGWWSISITVGRSNGFFSRAMVMKSRHCSLIFDGNLKVKWHQSGECGEGTIRPNMLTMPHVSQLADCKRPKRREASHLCTMVFSRAAFQAQHQIARRQWETERDNSLPTLEVPALSCPPPHYAACRWKAASPLEAHMSAHPLPTERRGASTDVLL